MADQGGFNYEDTVQSLTKYYRLVKKQILRHQHPVTGLFPCDLHKAKPQEAHVRDSIYCAVAVWSLAQAYKRIDDDGGRTHELAQSAVKCMRGILACWLRQADKLEKFKQSQNPKNALHSKFNLANGNVIYTEEEYEHLQIDCIALYLIFLVQMINSGLQIIFTTDEVTFVQNMVFYVERAYRTPDYGMWERGSKYHNGSSELHASSIGLVKAALESINGENLFGSSGSAWSVIYSEIDAHNRNRTIFDTILPRESNSKNTDASLIPTVSWPAFAIHEESLVHRTLDKAIRKLKGRYGLKRFLRDGYGTVAEERNRKYYRPAEIKNFDGIECEWPLFIAYLLIDSVFRGDPDNIERYQKILRNLVKETEDGPILPHYYYVPKERIEQERAKPGSVKRMPSNQGGDGHLFLWGQSVYIISQLLAEGWLTVFDLDPIRRCLPAAERPRVNSRYSSFQRGTLEQSSPSDLVCQVVLISESVRLQQMLATYGIQTQTPHQVEPIQIWAPSALAHMYENLGVNQKLGLTGRPPRPIGGLGTAKMYRASGLMFLCYPLLFEVSEFYLAQDMELLIDDIKTDLRFLAKCWKLAGRPTFCFVIREDNMRGPGVHSLFDLLAQFKRGECDGIRVRIGRLQEFISSACIEHLDFLNVSHNEDCQFKQFTEKDMGRQFRSLTNLQHVEKEQEELESWGNYHELTNKSSWDLKELIEHTDNLYIQAQVLQILLNREGRYHRIHDQETVEDKLNSLMRRACARLLWSVVRFCSALLGQVVDSLAPSITAILVRGKQVTIGVFGHEEEVIDKPMGPNEIKNILYSKCYPHEVAQAVLQQELIISIGKYITTRSRLFDGILKIRIGWIVQAMKLELKYAEEKDRTLNVLSPHAIKSLLLQVLTKFPRESNYRKKKKLHRFRQRSVIWNRQLDGALNRTPPEFYERVWQILERTPGGLKVAGYHLPQQPTLSDMTQYELNFSLLVEQMLSKIADPAYRQIMVETFMVVDTILERNKELSFQKAVNMDKIVHEAFELFQKDRSQYYSEEKTDDMNIFYNTPPNVRGGTTCYIAKAIMNHLLDGEVHMVDDMQCAIQ